MRKETLSSVRARFAREHSNNEDVRRHYRDGFTDGYEYAELTFVQRYDADLTRCHCGNPKCIISKSLAAKARKGRGK